MTALSVPLTDLLAELGLDPAAAVLGRRPGAGVGYLCLPSRTSPSCSCPSQLPAPTWCSSVGHGRSLPGWPSSWSPPGCEPVLWAHSPSADSPSPTPRSTTW